MNGEEKLKGKKIKICFWSHPYANEKCFDFTKHEITLDLVQTQDVLIKVNKGLLEEKIIRSWDIEECHDAVQCEKKVFIEKLVVSLGNKFLNGRIFYEPKDDNLVFDKIRNEMKNIIVNLAVSEFESLFSFLQKLYNLKKNYTTMKDVLDDIQKNIKNPDFKRIYCQLHRLHNLIESCKHLPTIELVDVIEEKQEE